MKTLAVVLAMSVAAGAGAQSAASAQRLRAPRVADRFEAEAILRRQVHMTRDGRRIAFTRIRSALSQPTHALTIDEARGDIWVHDAPGGVAQNVTRGASDSSGWWAPQWSPDGGRLAFLGSRGGNVALHVREGATGKIRQLVKHVAHLDYDGGCRWTDVAEMVCALLPEGEESALSSLDAAFPTLAEAAWERARRGEATASVVRSMEFVMEPRRLVAVDVATGTTRAIALIRRSDVTANWWMAPRYVAFVPPGWSALPQQYRVRTGAPSPLELRGRNGERVTLDRPLPENVVTTSVRWSQSGSELAFFALEGGATAIHPELFYGEGWREVRYPRVATKEYPGRLWRVDVANGTVHSWPTGDVDLGTAALPPAFEWTDRGELLFRAAALVNGARPVSGTGAEWLILGRDGRSRRLPNVASAPAPVSTPQTLEPLEGNASFIGVAQGDLWRVDVQSGAWTNLTATVDPVVRHFPIDADARGRFYVVQAGLPRTDAERWWLAVRSVAAFAKEYVVDAVSGAMREIERPGPEHRGDRMELVAQGGTSAAYWVEDHRRGQKLWRMAAGSPAETVASLNEFRAGIEYPKQLTIEYTTANGVAAKAKVTLPIGYRPGRRYPLVVDSDIGYTQTSPGALYDTLSWMHMDDEAARFAAGGYVYMFASMPTLRGMDEIGRGNLLLFTDGVLGAVDRAVELGFADPERLFIYGQSSMGFGVYGLVTQTSRFKAAVADVGWVSQETIGRGSIPDLRYSENPFELARLGVPYLSQGQPFWRNSAHLRRNSPLEYVDRVQTPLMMTVGDLDPVSNGLAESEQFFAALLLQRKPAELVRYFGEGHGKESPANGLDFYRRIYAWFDRWGDVSRDAAGQMVFEGDRVKSRKGAAPLSHEDYARFDVFAVPRR